MLRPMRLTSRPYASLDDLRAMQSIVTAAWLSDRRPLVSCTIGDLAWWFAGAGPNVDWAARIRIWTDARTDSSAGAGSSRRRDIDWFVAADLDEADERRLRPEIIALGRRGARGGGAPRRARQPRPIEAWAADGGARGGRPAPGSASSRRT